MRHDILTDMFPETMPDPIDILTQLEDDNDVYASVNCRCPVTNRIKNYGFLATDVDRYRNKLGELSGEGFNALSTELAERFVLDMKADLIDLMAE